MMKVFVVIALCYCARGEPRMNNDCRKDPKNSLLALFVHRIVAKYRAHFRWLVKPASEGHAKIAAAVTAHGWMTESSRNSSNGSKSRSRCSSEWYSRIQNVAMRQSIVFRTV